MNSLIPVSASKLFHSIFVHFWPSRLHHHVPRIFSCALFDLALSYSVRHKALPQNAIWQCSGKRFTPTDTLELYKNGCVRVCMCVVKIGRKRQSCLTCTSKCKMVLQDWIGSKSTLIIPQSHFYRAATCQSHVLLEKRHLSFSTQIKLPQWLILTVYPQIF